VALENPTDASWQPTEYTDKFFGVKANKFLVIAVIAFSMFGSTAFALVKSPYPRQASPADNSIVIADDTYGGFKQLFDEYGAHDMNNFKHQTKNHNPQEK
jgi:hypothetical protein